MDCKQSPRLINKENGEKKIARGARGQRSMREDVCISRKDDASTVTKSWSVIEYDRVSVDCMNWNKRGRTKQKLIWDASQGAEGIEWWGKAWSRGRWYTGTFGQGSCRGVRRGDKRALM